MKEKDECSILREMTIRRRRRESLSEIDDVCALLALAMMGFYDSLDADRRRQRRRRRRVDKKR